MTEGRAAGALKEKDSPLEVNSGSAQAACILFFR
jgi:hypothetical protein